ncbi:MAG TPA: hypothetical protein VEQ42_13260, partial [Pyrinomonadaceae bacterium]|nr:hypothetical protein [Pyrinomonadaceae bacterium]
LARGVSNFAAAASSCAPGGSDVAGSHGEGEGGASASASAPLSEPEVAEWAEACVSMLLAQGRPIAETLAGLSGGALGPEDASRVRRLAERLAGEASADGGGN